MKQQEKTTFKKILIKSIAGSFSGILFMVIGTALLSTLILNGTIPERQIRYFVLVLMILCAFLGTLIGRKNSGAYKNMVSIITGSAIFCTLLLVTAVLFGARYSGVGETGLLILCGCILPVLIRPTGRKRKKTGSRMVKLYKKGP